MLRVTIRSLTSERGAARLRLVLLLGGAAALVATGVAALTASAATTAVPPKNTAVPTISGQPVVKQTLTADPGTWTGDQPIVFTYHWQRCNAAGSGCVNIPNATKKTYAVKEADVDFTLRVQVTGKNSSGSDTAVSAVTAKVTANTGPEGQIKLPSGEVSIPVTSVTGSERLIVDSVAFTPNPVTTRNTTITVKIKVKDTRGYVVRDASVFLRSTPVVTSTPPEGKTGQDGTITYQVQPENDMTIRPGYSTQFYVKAFKQGDNPLAGISGSRLVQVGSTG